jgi:hypothetical protein
MIVVKRLILEIIVSPTETTDLKRVFFHLRFGEN